MGISGVQVCVWCMNKGCVVYEGECVGCVEGVWRECVGCVEGVCRVCGGVCAECVHGVCGKNRGVYRGDVWSVRGEGCGEWSKECRAGVGHLHMVQMTYWA